MPRWSVQLNGDKFDLEDFPEWFTNPDLQVVEELDGFYLKSVLFEPLEDAESVRSLAQELLERLIGAAKLFRPNLVPVELGPVVQQRKDGQKRHHILLVSSLTMRSKVSSVKLNVNGNDDTLDVPRPAIWASVAKDSEKVRQALRYWTKGTDSWFNLYKILEVIESDVGGEIFSSKWASKAAVNCFTQTANSYETLGDDARHAKSHIPPPSNPMNIQEAKQLIKSLLENWIESKTSA